MNFQKTIIMIDIVGLESIGKYIIWLWSKYVKRKHIPYMDLEFHYPNYLFKYCCCHLFSYSNNLFFN